MKTKGRVPRNGGNRPKAQEAGPREGSSIRDTPSASLYHHPNDPLSSKNIPPSAPGQRFAQAINRLTVPDALSDPETNPVAAAAALREQTGEPVRDLRPPHLRNSNGNKAAGTAINREAYNAAEDRLAHNLGGLPPPEELAAIVGSLGPESGPPEDDSPQVPYDSGVSIVPMDGGPPEDIGPFKFKQRVRHLNGEETASGRDDLGYVRPHQRNEQTAKIVEMLTACGATPIQIAIHLDIRPGQLRKCYAHELEHGSFTHDMQVSKTILDRAKLGDPRFSLFWAKARMGWRETAPAPEKPDEGPMLASAEELRKLVRGAK